MSLDEDAWVASLRRKHRISEALTNAFAIGAVVAIVAAVGFMFWSVRDNCESQRCPLGLSPRWIYKTGCLCVAEPE